METQVLIIGGGATGTGIARDLALRGIDCILVEQNDINAGASGGNHGLLHSGARYVAKDGEAARECHEENALLRALAPQCVETTGGLFVAVKGDDEAYIADFPGMCEKWGIPCRPLEIAEAREMEPTLGDNLVAAYEVQDAAVDPFMLSLDNIAQAETFGSRLLRHAKVVGFDRPNGHIKAARLMDTRTGEPITIGADQIINATGAWADSVAAMAGAQIPITYSKGTLLVTRNRMNHRVINRLRQAADADILVPGGTVSIIGTTSITTDTLDDIRPTPDEVDYIIQEGAAMVPELADTRYIRAYAGVRPLVGSKGGDGRNISRNFSLINHAEDGVENFITITGGKLTTYRLMAEKTADLVAERLKVDTPCQTRTTPLPSSRKGKWTEPGKAPKTWFTAGNPKDLLLCECEMVSKSVVDAIVEGIRAEGAKPSLTEVGLRSRIGKGPCQGCFCSLRIGSHLYDTGEIKGTEGICQVRDFVNERWKGLRPLIRSKELIQSDLQEAFMCGLFGLEQA